MTAPLRVLVADDAPDVCLLMTAVLSADGCVVRTAPGGDEALVALRAEPTDVLVLDIQMPDADGWAVLDALRSEPALSPRHIVVCSVKSSEKDRVRATDLGAHHYLVKPFEPDDLLAAVRRRHRAPETSPR